MSVEEKPAAVSLLTFCGRQRLFARQDEIQTEISPSSDESVVLNIRPLVELTARREKKDVHTHAHTRT